MRLIRLVPILLLALAAGAEEPKNTAPEQPAVTNADIVNLSRCIVFAAFRQAQEELAADEALAKSLEADPMWTLEQLGLPKTQDSLTKALTRLSTATTQHRARFEQTQRDLTAHEADTKQEYVTLQPPTLTEEFCLSAFARGA